MIPCTLWQLLQFLWEMKETANMFCINSITFIWTQSRMCDVVPQGLLICTKQMCWVVIKGIFLASIFPSGNIRTMKTKITVFYFEVSQCWNSKDRLLECKCPFNITLSFKKKEKNFKSCFMLMSSLIGIRKKCSGIERGSKISQKRKNKIKPSKGLFQRNYSVLWTSSKF